jgi:formamidopyrimidine-DNA glycosylase
LRGENLPELPEVETVVRGLQRVLPGRKILRVELGKTDFIDNPGALELELPGCCIISVRRHGKFIVVELEQGSPPPKGNDRPHDAKLLLVHLGMTGQLVVSRAESPLSPHTHVRFLLDDGRELRYADSRRFGRMLLVPETRGAEYLRPLGKDPLEITAEQFYERLLSRRARIKALLLDQHVFRGMGNIYTDESLWRAHLHPARIAAGLKPQESARLFRSMRKILREAIRLGGSTISDYVNASGESGEFQIRHRVYQREGKKCFRCGSLIRRIIVAGRSSYFCPRCQPAPRKRSAKPRRTVAVPPRESQRQKYMSAAPTTLNAAL